MNHEQRVFLDMTKKVKFRFFKKIIRMFSENGKAMRELIKYYFNYILYKIHILKKYDYRTNGEVFKGEIRSNKGSVVFHKNICATLVVRVFEYEDIHLEYFYRDTKNGKKITHMITNYTYRVINAYGVLNNIGVKIDGQENFIFNDFPIIRFYELPKATLFSKKDNYLLEREEVKPTRYIFNLKPLYNLRHKITEETTYKDFVRDDWVYDLMEDRFREYFKNEFKLKDIITVENGEEQNDRKENVQYNK